MSRSLWGVSPVQACCPWFNGSIRHRVTFPELHPKRPKEVPRSPLPQILRVASGSNRLHLEILRHHPNPPDWPEIGKGNSPLNICIYVHRASPTFFTQRVPGNAIIGAHGRGNARVNQSNLALKEGLVYTCKHEQNNDEAYLSSQMWTMKPCQDLFQFFDGVTWPHGHIPGARLTHSWGQVLVNVLCLPIFERAELWRCLPITACPVCLGFGHCSHTSGISTQDMPER